MCVLTSSPLNPGTGEMLTLPPRRKEGGRLPELPGFMATVLPPFSVCLITPVLPSAPWHTLVGRRQDADKDWSEKGTWLAPGPQMTFFSLPIWTGVQGSQAREDPLQQKATSLLDVPGHENKAPSGLAAHWSCPWSWPVCCLAERPVLLCFCIQAFFLTLVLGKLLSRDSCI